MKPETLSTPQAPRLSSVATNHHEEIAYRGDIDGLRAVAVLAVIGFHAFPEFVPGGFVGVDVFFVISGFLISSIIFRQLARSRFTLADFYGRRARRILPALCLVLASCLLFGFYALLPDEFTDLGKNSAASAAFVTNFSLWRESGYFAPSTEFQPLLHLWSLGIEEQFYLLWPLTLLFAWKRRMSIVVIVTAATAISFALNLMLFDRDPTATFYLPLARFWELGLGCTVAALRVFPTPATARALRPLEKSIPFAALIGIALIAIAAFAFDSDTNFPGVAALVPTIGAVCVVAGLGTDWFSRRILGSRPLVLVGLISYPLYLWHWPILSFAAILHSGKPSATVRTIAIALSVLLAIVTYRFIELPVRRRRPTRISLALVGTVAVIGCLGLAIYLQAGLPGRFGADVLAMRQPPRLDSLCLASVPEKNRFNYCRRTSPLPPDVVFLGDSQAQGIYEGTAAVIGHDFPMLLLGHGGCPPLLNVPAVSPAMFSTGADRHVCNAAWQAFADYVRSTKPPMVVLVGDGSRFFREPNRKLDPAARAERTRMNREAFRQGLTSLVATLQDYSRVIYVLEIPVFESNPTCFLRPVRLPGDSCTPRIPRAGLESVRADYDRSVREVQKSRPGLIVLDPIPALCGEQSCSQLTRSGELLYRDKMHLSFEGGRRFAQSSGLARLITSEASRSEGVAALGR